MRSRPEDLSDESVRACLARSGIDVAVLEHAPVGFGDHHWHVTDTGGRRWFATAADLTRKPHCGPDRDSALAGLRAAMGVAARLRQAGLEFVVAPVGEPVVELDDRYALSVFPHVAGVPGHFGQELSEGDGALVQELLARLHATPVDAPAIPIAPPPPDADGPWGDGPYAERARLLLAEHGEVVRRRRAEFAELAEVVRRLPVVLTHGEPHPGNLIRAATGFHLVDWDTTGLAVPERDLALLPGDLSRYRELTGRTPSPEALRLHRLRWPLVDLAEFTDLFRAPHGDDPDTALAWTSFQDTLAALATG